MKIEKTPSASPGRIQWHTAFVQAMRLELEPYESVLEFRCEHQLTSEPQIIDLVIILKEPGTVIDKNIAQAFKPVNILEYKSPGDCVSVWDFFKVLSYALQYAWQNGIDPEDITVTLVATRHPRELLKYIAKSERYAVTEESPGIYRVTGGPVDIQIMETPKLSSGGIENEQVGRSEV